MRKWNKIILSSMLVLSVFATAGCGAQSQATSSAETTNTTTATTEAVSTETATQTSQTATQTTESATDTTATPEEYYTFELSDAVTREHVSYKNRYGITINADLYTPKDMDKTAKYPALIVGPPYGGVKEQGPGVYANQLAQRGFVVLAFDPSFNGQSEGEPRHTSAPDIFVEDFSAGVDFLGVQAYVDREKIGAIGICGSGGFAISATKVDTRIKAVATASMYDISRMWKDIYAENMEESLKTLGEKRWEDFENGTPEYIPSWPEEPVDEIPADLDPVTAEFFSYYAMDRGFVPNARANFTTTSQLPFLNFQLLNDINTIAPRPILMIAGENAHSLYFSQDAYEAAAEPKELYIVPGAIHIDLYDRVDLIPFDKLESFFMDAFQQ